MPLTTFKDAIAPRTTNNLAKISLATQLLLKTISILAFQLIVDYAGVTIIVKFALQLKKSIITVVSQAFSQENAENRKSNRARQNLPKQM